MPIYDSSDSDNETAPRVKLFGLERPMHDILGRGKVADIVLWRDKKISGALLLAVSTIWFLFEVAEYNFVTLLCHIAITGMVVIFIWRMTADYFRWNRPKIPELLSNEHAFRDVAYNFHWRFNQYLQTFLQIASGNDPVHFFVIIISLYIISVIGCYCDFVNLLFGGFLCFLTLPYLYTRFEGEVDYHAGQITRNMTKMYRRFDSRVLNKIPRGPVKEKKHA